MSFGAGADIDSRAKGYYPPDWSHEVIQESIPEIEVLWNNEYDKIRSTYEIIVESFDDDKDDCFNAFCNGFLHGLRKVMVSLEKSDTFHQLVISSNFRTLVTEVDANEKEEEKLLNEIRISHPTA